MATTKKKPLPAETPPPRRRKPARKPKTAARGYAPSATGANVWTAFRSNVLDAKPVFSVMDIPRMLTDPVVQMGLNVLAGPLTAVEWEVRSQSREVASFVENAYKTFWRRHQPILFGFYLCHGYAPGVHDLDVSPGGELRYVRTRWVYPPDATALKFSAGERKGELAGFRLDRGADGDAGGGVYAPHCFWYGGLEKAGRFYDVPVIRGAFDPWLEKNTRGGGLHSRRLYHRTQAFRGQQIYHPDGYVTPGDPTSGLNRDYAQYIADTMENGTVCVFPDIRTGPDGKEAAWRIAPIEGNASAAVDMMEYVRGLADEMWQGMGIPPEVIQAAETGSGYSGRQVPMQNFLAYLDRFVGPLVSAFEPVVRHLVRANYGDAEFTVDTIPLQETAKRRDGNPTSAAAGGPPDEAEATGDADMAGSGGGGSGGGRESRPPEGGGGDPTGGGYVPYLGKRGGHGRKNPVTGRVIYMSHDGARVGCLMAEIPEPLRGAVLGFASTIPDNELADDGREGRPHVTISHGLTGFDPAAVFEAVAPLGSLSFAPGELRVFEGDGHDVLYVSCDDPSRWSAWHRAAGSLPGEPPDRPYVPHMTVAYLKRGKGKKYAGETVLKGGPVPIGTLVYAGPDDREHRCPVWPSQAELDDLLRAAVAT